MIGRFLCWLGFHEIPEPPKFHISSRGMVAYYCVRCRKKVCV
jgi:hypothetical protein